MIRIHVLPEVAMRDQNVKEIMVISIVSPGREHPRIIGDNVHKFHFHDVTNDLVLDSGIMNVMSEEIAESIAEIAMANRDCDRWIIHCEAGISRSPGVALGLAEHLKTKPDVKQLEEAFPFHNKHVRKLVSNAMREKIKELTKELDNCVGCDGGEHI